MAKQSVRLAAGVLFVIAILGGPSATRCGEPSKPRLPTLWPEALAKAKARMAAGEKSLAPAVERLRKDAEAALKAKPLSVVDNDLVPPSGDKHDYISFGPYWWPDPTKKDGLPYIRRDGEVYPQSRTNGSDSPAMGKMAATAETLALAYHLTGEERYAERAAKLLRVWFLDPATKMNPNLNFGQGIPGRVDGRGTGIIDTVCLLEVVNAVGLLQSSPAWRTQDQQGLIAWFAAYLEWLRTSKLGKDEAAASNNHGTWYDVQVASFALLTGQDALAREVIEASRGKRIARQIEVDGRQPAELARTKPLGYSAFNLQAMFALAMLGEKVGVELWRYETDDGRGLKRAIDFLAVYADPEKPWPYKDLKPDRARLIPLLQQAAAVYGSDYDAALEKYPAGDVAPSRGRLLYAH